MAEDRYYLTTDDDPKGRGLIAIITLGSPQAGDEHCTVCTLEVGFATQKEAEAWFKRMLVEQPWNERN